MYAFLRKRALRVQGRVRLREARLLPTIASKNPVFRKITLADLPEPHATKSVDNGPDEAARPANAWPQAPAGFKVELYAAGLDYPRLLRVAPNGDIFLAESHSGEIKVFRGVTRDGKAEQAQVFATGLRQPFGIAFYPSGKTRNGFTLATRIL